MDEFGEMSDQDLERVLTGRDPLGGDDSAGLGVFFDDLRSEYLVDPSPARAQADIARILAAARDVAPSRGAARAGGSAPPNVVPFRFASRPRQAPAAAGGGPVRPPVRAAAAGHSLASGRTPSRAEDAPQQPRWRRAVLGGVFSSVGLKVLAGVAVAAAATGGLAAGGKLPAPVQNVVASVAGGVGVHIPDPAATAAATRVLNARAADQASKVVGTVSTLVDEVTVAAQKPVTLSDTAARNAGTCAQNVSALAGQLAGLASQADTADAAQSLAAHATALGQESVGCALSVTQSPAPTSTTKATVIPAGAAQAVAGAVQACAPSLKASMQSLIQTALTATTPAQVQALAGYATAVADAAQACAQDVGSAVAAVIPALPAPLPTLPVVKAPVSTVLTVPAVPTAPAVAPGPVVVVPPVPAGIPNPLSQAENWTQLLSTLPAYPGSTMPMMPGTSGQSWSGLTGSWTSSGGWNPYGAASGGHR